MQPFWSPSAEQVVRRLLANPLAEPHPDVLAEADRRGALPVGWDLWSHFFLRPDGTLLKVEIELGDGAVETFTDRIHVLWGLVMGSERYPELRDLIPERPGGARDCECLELPPNIARVFCSRSGGVKWLPPDDP